MKVCNNCHRIIADSWPSYTIPKEIDVTINHNSNKFVIYNNYYDVTIDLCDKCRREMAAILRKEFWKD